MQHVTPLNASTIAHNRRLAALLVKPVVVSIGLAFHIEMRNFFQDIALIWFSWSSLFQCLIFSRILKY